MSKTYLGDGSDDGTVLGRSATDKIAFYNAAPVVQQTIPAPPAATAATSSTPFGFSQTQADAIVAWIRAVDTDLKALGLLTQA